MYSLNSQMQACKQLILLIFHAESVKQKTSHCCSHTWVTLKMIPLCPSLGLLVRRFRATVLLVMSPPAQYRQRAGTAEGRQHWQDGATGTSYIYHRAILTLSVCDVKGDRKSVLCMGSFVWYNSASGPFFWDRPTKLYHRGPPGEITAKKATESMWQSVGWWVWVVPHKSSRKLSTYRLVQDAGQAISPVKCLLGILL